MYTPRHLEPLCQKALADGKAEERRVKTGARTDGRVEILEGVKVGENVATSNLSQLATGTAVVVQSGSRNNLAPAKSENGRPEGATKKASKAF